MCLLFGRNGSASIDRNATGIAKQTLWRRYSSVIQKRNKNRAAVCSLRHDSSNKRMRPIRRIPVNVTSPAELVRRRSTRDLGSSRCSVRGSSRQVGQLAAVGGYSYRFYKKWFEKWPTRLGRCACYSIQTALHLQ